MVVLAPRYHLNALRVVSVLAGDLASGRLEESTLKVEETRPLFEHAPWVF